MKKRKIAAGVFLAIMVVGIAAAGRGPFSQPGVLVMELGGDIPEAVRYNPLAALLEEEQPILLDKILCLRQAARDPRIKGVVVRITDAAYSFGKAQELREALQRFRADSGKPVYACLELERGGNIEYYVATACDRIYLSPASTLNLTGLAIQRYYLGGLWEKIYVDMQVDQIREYKSAADMLHRRNMSDHEREMLNSILDSTFEQFVSAIATARGVSPETVRAWIDAAWLVADQYAAAGVVDGIRYLDEAVEEIAGEEGAGWLAEKDYFSPPSPKAVKLPGAVNVAVIFAEGPIVAGEGKGVWSMSEVITSDALVQRLREAAQDEAVDAVILRIDSGGGSALASDLIWHAVLKVKEKKPIVVSMSDTAGSGGYYIACSASRIVAHPGTITGSIGILTAHPSIGRLLEKIGVGAETITRGQFADLHRLDRPLSPQQLSRLHDSIASLYALFVGRVSEGRRLSKERVNELGRGRIYTGEQAREVGLVDVLGGYDTAVGEIRALLGLPADKAVNLIYRREEVSFWKLLRGKAEETILSLFLRPGEQELIRALRQESLFPPGQPLALMPPTINLP